MLVCGLSAYSFPFSAGFLQRDGMPACPQPLDFFQLVTLARQHGLSSVEAPLTLLGKLDEDTVQRAAVMLKDLQMNFVLDMGVLDVEQAQRALPIARQLGARVARCLTASFLEGARAAHAADWNRVMREMIHKILALRPLLDALDMHLAIENHQDVTSADLTALCDAGGPRVGVTLDVVNPLAVAEDPYTFAERVADRILNVLPKDYTIHPTPSGYLLVRAAIGQGVMDWVRLLSWLRQRAPNASWHIELAALEARHIRLYEEAWWRGYPPRDVRDVLPLLRFVARHAQHPAAEWRTPWERGEDADACTRYEMTQLEQSVAYLRQMSALLPSPA